MSIFTKIFRLLFWAPILTWELFGDRFPIEEVPYGNGIASHEDYAKSLWKTVILGWVFVALFIFIWFLPEIEYLPSNLLLWGLAILYLLTGFLHSLFNDDE